MERFNIKIRLLCDEKSNKDKVEIEISKINNEIMNYNPNDVYHVHETGVLFGMVPSRTLSWEEIAKRSGHHSFG